MEPENIKFKVTVFGDGKTAEITKGVKLEIDRKSAFETQWTIEFHPWQFDSNPPYKVTGVLFEFIPVARRRRAMTDLDAIQARLAAALGYVRHEVPDEDGGGNTFLDVYWTNNKGDEVGADLDAMIVALLDRIEAFEHDKNIQAGGLQRLGKLGAQSNDPAGGVVVDWDADTIEQQQARIAALEAALREMFTFSKMGTVASGDYANGYNAALDDCQDIARRALEGET